MDSVPLNKIIFFCSYGCFPTSMLMLDHTTSLPWLNAIGKSLCCFRKSIACKILALYWFSWFSDCGKLVPMALIQLSSSIQWSQNQTSYSPHNLTLLKNKSDTQPVKKKTVKVSLLFAFQSQVWLWFGRGSCIHIQSQQLYHLDTSCSTLMFKCGILDELRSFWNRIGEICLF